MAVLTRQTIVRAGIAAALAAAAGGGDSFDNDGNTFLEVVNGSGGSITVNVQGYADGQTVAALRTYAIGAGTRRLIGPFPPAIFNDAATGRVVLTYSGVTSLTVGAFVLNQE